MTMSRRATKEARQAVEQKCMQPASWPTSPPGQDRGWPEPIGNSSALRGYANHGRFLGGHHVEAWHRPAELSTLSESICKVVSKTAPMEQARPVEFSHVKPDRHVASPNRAAES